MEFRLDFFDGRQAALEIVRQDIDEAGLPVRDAQGLGEVAQGVFHDHAVLALAEQQADGGGVVGVAHQVVHGGEVQVHLADEGGAERDRLELDDDVPAELEVVEQQVHAEVAVADLEEHLPADEGESGPHLQQEALDVVHETLFELPFRARFGGAEEVEQVRVLERLRGQIGVGLRQRLRKIRDRLSLPLVQAALDL